MSRAAGYGLVFVMWASVMLALFYPVPAPVEFFGKDSVSPATVKPGGTISVTRNFRVLQEGQVFVTRTMVRGMCPADCEVLDLSSGELVLEFGKDGGTYTNVKREHVLPTNIRPGVWRLLFTIQWEDRLGRKVTKKLPELSVEVVN